MSMITAKRDEIESLIGHIEGHLVEDAVAPAFDLADLLGTALRVALRQGIAQVEELGVDTSHA